jgi:YVTN family beta-propeller protein
MGWRSNSLPILAAGIALVVPLSTLGAADDRFHVVQEILLGGDGGWDYLTFDADARRLYISRSTRVEIFDPDSGKVIGTVPDTPGVHGIALAKELGKGYTSNGRDGTVTVFDLETLRKRGRIGAGTNPDAILFEPTTQRVFAFNGGSHDVTVIDAKTDAVVRTFPVGGKPEFAVADGQGRVYVNIEDTSEVLSIDARELSIDRRWPVAPCEGPTGISMDAKRGRLFVGCSNKLMAIVDADQGRLIATLSIGDGCDATAFDSQSNLAFSSNGDGTLTVVREDRPGRFVVWDSVPTKVGARTMALDSPRRRIYLVTASFGPRPAATSDQPRPRPPMVPDSFTLLVLQH